MRDALRIESSHNMALCSLNNALMAVCVFRVGDEYYFSQDAMFDVRGKLSGEIYWKMHKQ